ncbi:rRNA maturation RNase YbeY [Psychrobacter pygoscelis]|uniref:rRNA maturation RNase YbeY n=1 Tax=Psychrobacter pygoscelis TaxID=2488563 RepID=UPI00104033C3|nr:rRNA maturation RNase YbeY [Psychrobacter pygoscelis]
MTTASESPSAFISVSEAETIDPTVIAEFYDNDNIQKILTTTLAYMNQQLQSGLVFPYFTEVDATLWQQKPKELDVYITDEEEGRQLNLDARGKDYATNILSYPSDLPTFILAELPTLPLGELILCQSVVEQQASEQGKPLKDHVTHLLVHGILHLLGFDHELGQAEQDEMESFEIAILSHLGVANPY